jgi:hypothetical protein
VFVGGRVIPGRYPETPSSYLLVNDGKGNFTNQISALAPSLEKIGMVTDALWIDLDGDTENELVVVGEWMPVSVFSIQNGKLENRTKTYFDKAYSGWWNTVTSGDFNNDGKADLIVGNAGLNTQFKVSDQQPAELYFKDFDKNGSVDPFFGFYIQGRTFPYVTRDEMLEQIGGLRSRFTTFKSYADITLNDVFKPEDLSSAGHLTANHMATTYFQSSVADEKFHVASLPPQVQFSPIYAIIVLDYNHDGNEDLLVCGNNSNTKLRLGKADANYGVLLKGDEKGEFRYIDQPHSGFDLRGDVRSVATLDKKLLFGLCQQGIVSYRLRK